jgi:aspartate aminotransferase
VVPGVAFGAPGHLRISYATSMDRIDEGLKRMARFFGKSK